MTKGWKRGKATCEQHGHETYTALFALYTCTRLASSSMVASFFGLLRKKRSMVSRVTSATATHRRAVKDRMEHGNVLNSTRFEFLSFGPCPASLAAGTLIAEESLTACLQIQNRWPQLLQLLLLLREFIIAWVRSCKWCGALCKLFPHRTAKCNRLS